MKEEKVSRGDLVAALEKRSLPKDLVDRSANLINFFGETHSFVIAATLVFAADRNIIEKVIVGLEEVSSDYQQGVPEDEESSKRIDRQLREVWLDVSSLENFSGGPTAQI